MTCAGAGALSDLRGLARPVPGLVATLCGLAARDGQAKSFGQAAFGFPGSSEETVDEKEMCPDCTAQGRHARRWQRSYVFNGDFVDRPCGVKLPLKAARGTQSLETIGLLLALKVGFS